MSEPAVVHDTFTVHRIFPHPPERVFAAFADPTKKRKWFAEGHSNEVVRFEGDFRVGGTEATVYRMGDKTPFPGVELSAEGTYLDIVENKRIVQAGSMALGGRIFSTSMATFEFVRNEVGTEMTLTHQGAFFEGSDGPKMRQDGWNKLIDSLAASF
jgi:uncharacterized protein YndB with AHSA1/START domain